MSEPPDNEKGAAPKDRTPRKKFQYSENVKPEQMARWIDDAIFMCRKAAADPVEFQRLGIWLARIRRTLP